ncbi:MAG: PAS domain S-box protein, partial [Verrucomicrobia bacterium]|nr:PAS domain S-box protein [Verrucomicrobiota bacterium]
MKSPRSGPPRPGRRRLPKRELAIDQLSAERATLLEGQRELEASRQELADLYDQLPVGYVTLDPSGCIRDLNLPAAALLGLPRRQLLDKPLLPLVAKHDRRNYLSYLGRLRRCRHPHSIELEILTRQGSPITVQLISVPGGTADQSPQLFRTALVDSTEQRKADDALRQAQQRLDLALKASGAVAWSWNVVANRFEDWSPEYRQLYGFSTGEPPRFENWLVRIHPDDRGRVVGRVRQMLTTPVVEVWHLDFRIVHPERGERWIRESGRTFYEPGDRVLWMAGVDRDITEEKRAAERAAYLL